MSDTIIRAFAIIGVFTVGYHLEMLSRRIAAKAHRKPTAAGVPVRGEEG